MPQPESGSVQPHKFLPSSDAKSELRGAPVDGVLKCHKLEKPVLLIILPYLPIYHEIVQIHFILINYRKEDTHLFLHPNSLSTIKEIKAIRFPMQFCPVSSHGSSCFSIKRLLCNFNPISTFKTVTTLVTVIIVTAAATSLYLQRPRYAQWFHASFHSTLRMMHVKRVFFYLVLQIRQVSHCPFNILLDK